LELLTSSLSRMATLHPVDRDLDLKSLLAVLDHNTMSEKVLAGDGWDAALVDPTLHQDFEVNYNTA
jgi:hypothetical protein